MDELTALIEYCAWLFRLKKFRWKLPGELTPPNIGLLKQSGVNRLSVGVQSFSDDVLKTMGGITAAGGS